MSSLEAPAISGCTPLSESSVCIYVFIDCAWLRYHPARSFNISAGTTLPSGEASVSHHCAVRARSCAKASEKTFSSVSFSFFAASSLALAVVILDSAAPAASTSLTPYNLKFSRSVSESRIWFSTFATSSERYCSLSAAMS